MPATDLVLAWLEEASSDFQAGRMLMEGGFHSQATFLAFQAAAKALKSLLQHFRIPEGSGLHPALLFEELLKKPEGSELKPLETKLLKSLKMYKYLEVEGNAAKFPKQVETRIFAPQKEFKGIHSAKALTHAREILGLCETFFKVSLVTSPCR